MGLEDFSPEIESADGLSGSSEGAKEVSEKFKEAVKKASAGIKRTKKDEKKAKKYDFLLANFLVKIIVDKKYDFLLEKMFQAMDYGYTSNFIVGIVSLIHTEIANKIRELAGDTPIDYNFRSEESMVFNDAHVPDAVKKRINQWIEDMIHSVTIEYSNLQANTVLQLLEKDDAMIYDFVSLVFRFFLAESNMQISSGKALSIADYIISQELKTALKKLEIIDL